MIFWLDFHPCDNDLLKRAKKSLLGIGRRGKWIHTKALFETIISFIHS